MRVRFLPGAQEIILIKSIPMKFEQRMTQRLEQEQAHKSRQKLELKLDQKIGEFEKQCSEDYFFHCMLG